MATDVVQECREACGGAGYLSVNRFDALRADTDVFTTFEGDNTILLQLVAKGRLTDLKTSFGALDQIGIVRATAPALFRALGCEVIELFSEVDGNFPNHHPDPSKPENLQDVMRVLRETDADEIRLHVVQFYARETRRVAYRHVEVRFPGPARGEPAHRGVCLRSHGSHADSPRTVTRGLRRSARSWRPAPPWIWRY